MMPVAPDPSAHEETTRKSPGRLWPWALLMLAIAPSIWHVAVFPNDLDGEFPGVVRPTFSARPPSSYRLAEPGDTLDRVAMYLSVAVMAVGVAGWSVQRRAGMWPAVVAVSALSGWFAATPGPCYDGWHGLGWRAIGNPLAPIGLRLGLGVALLGLLAVIVVTLLSQRRQIPRLWQEARHRGASWFLVLATILMAMRLVEVPGVEPAGYWPRWCLVWGVLALLIAAIRLFPACEARPLRRLAVLGVAGGGLLIAGGLWITELHRPLQRLRAVVPGGIYISAMPTYRGLEIEQKRLGFKTIINLFDEATPQRSPRIEDELRFARENGIRYIGSPGPAMDSDEFLDQTLAIAKDQANWPILVHCHGCMDRSPAWMGIYRFVVQGRPLEEILREIEAHRGVRPKASVTLLYNHVLPTRAPQAYKNDPTAHRLQKYAEGTIGPYDKKKARQIARPNPSASGSVSR